MKINIDRYWGTYDLFEIRVIKNNSWILEIRLSFFKFRLYIDIYKRLK